jgi:hypothetical protein
MLQGTITNLFGEMVVVVAPYGLLSAPIPIPTATPMGFLSLVASSSHVSLDALRKLACRGVLSVASSRLASRPARPAANIPRTDRPSLESIRPTGARLPRGVKEDHAISHVHLHLFRQTALLDEGLRYPNATRVADRYKARFHATICPTVAAPTGLCRCLHAQVGAATGGGASATTCMSHAWRPRRKEHTHAGDKCSIVYPCAPSPHRTSSVPLPHSRFPTPGAEVESSPS